MPCNSAEYFELWILHLCYDWKANSIELGHDRSKTARNRVQLQTLQCTPRTHPSHTRRIRRKQKYVQLQAIHYTRTCVSAEYICCKSIHLLIPPLMNSDEDQIKNSVLFPRHKDPRSKFWPRRNWSKVNELRDEHQKIRENEKPQNLNQYLVAALGISCAF